MIDALEAGFYTAVELDIGQVPGARPWHVLVNGWYYYSFSGTSSVAAINFRWLVRAPGAMWRFVRAIFGKIEHIDPRGHRARVASKGNAANPRGSG